jgi:hypothetical protein
MKAIIQLFTIRFSEALMFSTLLLFSANAVSQHNIGRVIHASGKLVATNEGGSRVLTRGSNITEGDVLNTGATTRSQLRMMDGALISLRRNTKISFDEYQYKPEDSSANSSIFSLLRGGFNTISGLIGKKSKKNYRVNTPVATIGIRGTHYGVTLCSQSDCVGDPNEKIEDGLYASVIDGEISSENIAGYFVFSNDEYFHIADADSAPRSLVKSPGVVFGLDASAEQIAEAINESTSDAEQRSLQLASVSHKTIDQNKSAQSNLGYKPFFASADDINSNTYMVTSNPGNAMMYSFYQPGAPFPTPLLQTLVDDGSANNQFALNAIAAADNLLVPTASRITFGAGPTVRELYIANATYNDIGAITLGGTNVGWGRWTGSLYDTKDDGVATSHTGSLHYIVADALTTPAQYGAMTGSFAYTTVGGTRATDQFGSVAASVANVNMGVDFTLQNIDTYTVATNVGGNTYAAELGAPTAIATAINTGMILTNSAACLNCGGTANLAFVGAQAEGAITNYNIGDASSNIAVNGSAILQR